MIALTRQVEYGWPSDFKAICSIPMPGIASYFSVINDILLLHQSMQRLRLILGSREKMMILANFIIIFAGEANLFFYVHTPTMYPITMLSKLKSTLELLKMQRHEWLCEVIIEKMDLI